jgi:nucleotide-binding universal stress UspA family protein
VIAPPSVLVSVAAQLGGGTMHDAELEREAARMWFEEQAADAPEAEAVLLEGDPAPAACEWARGAGCDLMVAASHSGLIERSLLGSFAGHLAFHAPCAVLLVRPDPEAAG